MAKARHTREKHRDHVYLAFNRSFQAGFLLIAEAPLDSLEGQLPELPTADLAMSCGKHLFEGAEQTGEQTG